MALAGLALAGVLRATAGRAPRHLILGLLLAAWMGGVAAAAGENPTWRELNDQGAAAAAAKSWTAAETAFRQALDLLEPDPPKGPLAPDDDARIAVVAANLAMVELAQGDVAAARGHFERALAIRRALFGESEPGIAALLNNLGELERGAGHPERARELHERALAMRRALREPGHPEIAESLNNLAVTLRDQGMADKAAGLAQEALAMRRERLGPTNPATLESASNAAAIAIESGDLAGAETLLRSTLEAIAADQGAADQEGAGAGGTPKDEELVTYLRRNLVEVLLLRGADDEALAACEPAVGGQPQVGDQVTIDLVTVCARAFDRAGAGDRAMLFLKQQLERTQDRPDSAEAQLQLRWALAEAATSAGDLEAARGWIDQVIGPLEANGDRRLPLALNNRAYLSFELGHPLDAATDLQAALASLDAMPEPVDRGLERDVLNNLASVLRSLGRVDEATAVEERLLEAVPALGPTEPAPASGG